MSSVYWFTKIEDYKSTPEKMRSKLQTLTFNGQIIYLSIDSGVPIYVMGNMMQLEEEFNYVCSRDIKPIYDPAKLQSGNRQTEDYLQEIEKSLKGGCTLGMRGPTGASGQIDVVNLPIYAEIAKLSSLNEIEYMTELYRAYTLNLDLPDMWACKPRKCGSRNKDELTSLVIEFFKTVDLKNLKAVEETSVKNKRFGLHFGLMMTNH